MATYQCPNPSREKYTVNTLNQKLKSDSAFAAFFSAKLKLALAGDREAIACVDSYYEPSDSELQSLGIPSSQWSVMRKCTDSGSLVATTGEETSEDIKQS
ncbi:MAG: hypothetical protein WAO00_05810 [Chthoniobacterales bacterium]